MTQLVKVLESPKFKTVEKYLQYAIILASVVCLLYLIKKQLFIVFFPYQLEFREGAVLNLTDALTKGINPYLLENQPWRTSIFGVFYNLVTLPLALIFGPNAVVHRVVSSLSIWMAFYILYKWFRQLKTPVYIILPLLILPMYQYCETHAFSARPGALGIFIMLLSIYLALKKDHNFLSLFLIALLTFCAFMTKSYFGISTAIIGLYFLLNNFKSTVIYSLSYFLIAGIFILLAINITETYFGNIFFFHINIAGKDEKFLKYQNLFYQNNFSEVGKIYLFHIGFN